MIAKTLTSMLLFLGLLISSPPDRPQDPPRGSADGNIPHEWAVGRFDRNTRAWIPDEAVNIKWVTALGSQTYATPAVSGGKVFIGTDNSHGYLPRYPARVDVACLVCVSASNGEFLWQFSSEKIDEHHDFPGVGICSTPWVEGDRLWFVTNRGTVVCADTEGFRDGEDDGPVRNTWAVLFRVSADRDADAFQQAVNALKRGEIDAGLRERFAMAGTPLPRELSAVSKLDDGTWTFTANVESARRQLKIELDGSELVASKQLSATDRTEADVVWVYDMMAELGVSQHNMANGSIAAFGDILFVSTSNGVDALHEHVTNPDAPSLIAMDKRTGKVYWTDNTPGANILHGQWSSPVVATLGGIPQVLFAAGDGWLYSFRADQGRNGKPELLWRFDVNPKEAVWQETGRGDRNNIIASPVVAGGRIYVAVGQDPEHGAAEGHLWCIDPTRRGDVSEMLVVGEDGHPAPQRRVRAIEDPERERVVKNPNSAVVWHYQGFDLNTDGEMEYEEQMHRSIGQPVVHENLLFIADMGGILHCLHSVTGQSHWTYDLFGTVWATALVADGRVFVADEDGDVAIFKLSTDAHEPLAEINMRGSIYSSPIVVDGVLYIASRSHLFAIQSAERRP